MKDRLRLYVLLLFLFCGTLPLVAQAQELILGDHQAIGISASSLRAIDTHLGSKGSGIQTFAPFPLREDFSYDSLRPSSSIWEVAFSGSALDRVPGISTQKGLNPPTKGVCSFDGATFLGTYYESEFSTGEGDSLTSLPFDLSTFSPSDSIYLSFYVQRGGRNDVPEALDSLILYADTTGNRDYERIWAMGGSTLADQSFSKQMVALVSPAFFHNGFRFKFVNSGSLNGEFDVWHLDLVEMRTGRTVLETESIDISPTQVVTPPLAPYSSVPLDHFVLTDFSSTAQILASNIGANTASGSVGFALSDSSGQNTLSGTTSFVVSGQSFGAASSQIVATPSPFDDQSGNYAQYGSYSLRSIVSVGADAFPENDTLHFYSGVDSVLAYDDGICDAAYGLTAARSFCQEFRIPAQDTLTAVWIYFTPYIYVSPQGVSYPLETRQFRLSVWDTLAVDSFMVQTSQGMIIDYGNGLNNYQRFPLGTPLVVDTLFWLGMRQIDAIPVGVGFDRNFDNTEVYYESSNGTFVQTTNQGTLMIRPEFTRAGSQTVSTIPVAESKLDLAVFPNPGGPDGRALKLVDAVGLKNVLVEVFSIEGKRLAMIEWVNPSSELFLPSEYFSTKGIFAVRITAMDGMRGVVQHSELLVVE